MVRRFATLTIFTLGVWFCVMAAGTSALMAQALQSAVVAVIDYQMLMRESSAASSIRSQVELRRKTLQSEIGEVEQRLLAESKELEKQRTVLAPDAYQKRRTEFEDKYANFQRDFQRRRQQLDQVSAAALNEVRNTIIDVAGVLAEERGFNVVLPSSSVLLFAPELDLTQQILDKLNERLPEVEVPQALE